MQDDMTVAWIAADDEGDIQSLVRDLKRGGRRHPVVVLTAESPDSVVIVPELVRDIVGHGTPIWFVPERLRQTLCSGLPSGFGLGPDAGRLYWPGVVGGRPRAHPLLLGGGATSTLRSAMSEGRPIDPARVPTRVVKQNADLLRDRARLHEEAARLARQLADAQGRLNAERRRRETLERQLERLGGSSGGDGDLEAEFHIEVVRAWAGALARDERRDQPLGVFTLGRQFTTDLVKLAEATRDRVAWVCAMVACGRAPGLDGLSVHQFMTPGGGRQRIRADGAKAWRCAVHRGTPGAGRLHWWALPGGALEFANVGHHDRFWIAE